ncbi:hypothetical protein GOP47_0006727 [Adiantum capillus-veneris]|uniref:GDSL esterase/lipase n=1 Tax=Adiantum capillus-veneris TaxID=13818 RepID=A0A9D4V462_ADICA|nr:hypothetical protein GOP47_0006727 [Adiantum capillus-veneris]
MAATSRFMVLVCVLQIWMSILPTPVHAAGRGLRSTSSTSCPTSFSPVFAFGDSTTDTGNAIVSTTASVYTEATKLPYGSTFFNKPTGRFSDGRLMVDDLMLALKLPLLPPHLANQQSSSHSENYAVAGATALDVATLQHLAGVSSTTPDSLGVQLGWFKSDTAHVDLSNALVYVGEIGGNDYNYALAATHSPSQAASLVSPVIAEISSFLDDLLTNTKVKKVVVQGQFPMGCLPIYLTTLGSTPKDSHGCVAAVSVLSDQHNQLLKQAISTLSKKHPEAQIVFFDTTAAYLHILDNAAAYHFTNVKDACFPGGLGLIQGSSTNGPCSNPQNYISWDGIHMTDAMYAAMMNLFLSGKDFSSSSPNFITSTTSCS